jgi:acetyltransferase-like isoleucine patch superfamily enzyme
MTNFLFSKIGLVIDHIVTFLLFYSNGIDFKEFKTNGVPKVFINITGKCTIDSNLRINNCLKANPIGRIGPCCFVVWRGACLRIGKNVGMTSTTIVCSRSIEIGDYVMIGGNVVIYDTDFHSLNYKDRQLSEDAGLNVKSNPVVIKSNSFIGAHSTILKGVTIGENSIIGACSVVTKNIPDNEIWAGNPIRFIRKCETN